jgi:hypothetical protein
MHLKYIHVHGKNCHRPIRFPFDRCKKSLIKR